MIDIQSGYIWYPKGYVNSMAYVREEGCDCSSSLVEFKTYSIETSPIGFGQKVRTDKKSPVEFDQAIFWCNPSTKSLSAPLSTSSNVESETLSGKEIVAKLPSTCHQKLGSPYTEGIFVIRHFGIVFLIAPVEPELEILFILVLLFD